MGIVKHLMTGRAARLICGLQGAKLQSFDLSRGSNCYTVMCHFVEERPYRTCLCHVRYKVRKHYCIIADLLLRKRLRDDSIISISRNHIKYILISSALIN